MQAMAASPELRQRIEAVYKSALQVNPNDWPSFLDKNCDGNDLLRREVESLLSDHQSMAVGASAAELSTQILLEEKSDALVGQTLLQYKILSLLGKGGMGEVYLAYDTKLARNVALKLLPKSLSADEDRLRRFAREARSASALNHPNVCVIHDIGETNDGRHYIAMEHIDGVTLRTRIKQGPIPLDEALRITEQIAAALETAHKAGVIHRDIKPENIMLRPDGYVKVLDFGLAKLTERYNAPSDSDAATFPAVDTASDRMLGTVNYLSPEQARRQPIDERTDVWSLGVVLYEMLCGRMPFQGETVGHAIVAILEQEPEPLVKSLSTIPATLERIVDKALKKKVTERYPGVHDFTSDLQTLKRELSTGSFETAKAKRPPSPLAARAVLAILVVLIAGGVIFLLTRNRQPAAEPPATTINSVAVLPFVNQSNNPNVDYLSEGMAESLINDLSQLPNMKVISRNSAFRYKGSQKDTQTVADELGVQAILTGRIVERDGNISIYVELEDARNKHHIWGAQYNRKLADVLIIQDEISHKVTENLRLKLSGVEEQRLAKQATQNADAYQLYLKGRWYWNKFTRDGKVQAIAAYQEAIKLDPNYALAYAGLADAYVIDSSVPLRESSQRAKAAAEKALMLDNSLGEAHATLGLIKSHYEMDWAGAEAEFKRAIELNPSYATAHRYYGDIFLARGNFDKARQEYEKARELDPFSPVINSNIGLVYFYERDYDRCIEHSKRVTQRFSEFFVPHILLAWSYTQKKMFREAIAEYREALRLSNGHTYVQATLAYTYAVSGQKNEAGKILKELTKRSTRENVSPMRFVMIHLGLGDKERVLQWLERAREELDLYLSYIGVHPFFDPLRTDPKFQDFVQRLGLASQ